MKFAKVLNGLVYTGDTVAYAVRSGDLAGMRIGRVSGFAVRKASNRETPVMLIEIASGSDFGTPVRGKIVRVEHFERVVKLNPTRADAYPVETCTGCGKPVRFEPIGEAGGLLMALDGATSYCSVGGDGGHVVQA